MCVHAIHKILYSKACEYIYIYRHTHTYTYMYVCILIHVCTWYIKWSLHSSMYQGLCKYIYRHTHTYTYTCVCIFIHVCIRYMKSSLHSAIYQGLCIYIYTDTHTHTHIRMYVYRTNRFLEYGRCRTCALVSTLAHSKLVFWY